MWLQLLSKPMQAKETLVLLVLLFVLPTSLSQAFALKLGCAATNPSGACTSCSVRYYMGTNNTCRAVDPTCNNYDTRTGACLSCYAGYGLSEGRCLPGVVAPSSDPNCRQFDGFKCVRCSNRHYFGPNGKCQPVNPNCYTYNSNTGQCLSCNQGYILTLSEGKQTCVSAPPPPPPPPPPPSDQSDLPNPIQGPTQTSKPSPIQGPTWTRPAPPIWTPPPRNETIKPYEPPPIPDLSPLQFVRFKDAFLEGETFGQAMKRLSPRLSGEGFSVVRGKGRRLLVPEEVQTRLDQFQTSPSIPTYDFQSESAFGWAAGQTCRFEGMSYSSPTNEFLHVNQNQDSIFPGSVLMSRYLKGALDSSGQQVIVPDDGRAKLKNPRISVYDQLNVDTFTENYDVKSISKAVSDAIGLGAPQNKDYTIYFEMATTDEMADLATRLSFSRALLRRLGIGEGSSITDFTKRIFFIFTKPIATFEAVIQSPVSGLPDTPLNTFYSPQLTLSQFNANNPRWWSAPNPPVYIDSVTYGSLLILTVNFNSFTNSLYNQLQTAASPADAQPILNTIITDSSLQVFSRGPFNAIEINAIRNGNWKDMFIRVPNSNSNTIVQPLVYSVKDFNQARFNAANQFNYVKVCASPSFSPPQPYKILIQLDYVLNKAPIIVTIKTLSGQTVFTKHFYSGTKFDITSYLSELQMKVIIRATASNPTNADYFQSQQAVVGFVVNKVYTKKLEVNCYGRCQTYDAGVFIVRKQTGKITP